MDKLSILEIKAMIYDQIIIAETAQKNIQMLNEQLLKRKQVEVKEEVKAE